MLRDESRKGPYGASRSMQATDQAFNRAAAESSLFAPPLDFLKSQRCAFRTLQRPGAGFFFVFVCFFKKTLISSV